MLIEILKLILLFFEIHFSFLDIILKCIRIKLIDLYYNKNNSS
jgi:hypothetical protein